MVRHPHQRRSNALRIQALLPWSGESKRHSDRVFFLFKEMKLDHERTRTTPTSYYGACSETVKDIIHMPTSPRQKQQTMVK